MFPGLFIPLITSQGGEVATIDDRKMTTFFTSVFNYSMPDTFIIFELRLIGIFVEGGG